jgi:hypothetical protein
MKGASNETSLGCVVVMHHVCGLRADEADRQLHAFFLQPMRRPPLFDPCGRIVIGGVLEQTR